MHDYRSTKSQLPPSLLISKDLTVSPKKLVAAVFAAALIVTAGCSSTHDDKQSAKSPAKSTSASRSTDSAAGSEDGSAGEISSSTPTEAGRSQLPDGASDPYGSGMDDQSVVWAYSRILLYTNSYPGTVQLVADAPEYDAEVGGYTVETSFVAYSGYDIILASEWTLSVDGQHYKASTSPDAAAEPYYWLAVRSPIGNHPEAVANGVSGKLYFPIPQTSAPITMAYDNVSGDVHYKWADGGQK